ncbi:MAG: PAS domain S-box protein [Balneola sp.]
MNLDDVKHSLLRRQIKTHLTSLEKIPAGLSEFIRAIEESYSHFDSDRELLERSMEISSEELLKSNELLSHKLEIQKKTEEKLYHALKTLGVKEARSARDLIKTAELLNEEISLNNEAQKRRKESEAKLKSIIDSALDAVIVTNEYGIITEWNKQAEQTFGWERKEIIGSEISIIIPESDIENYKKSVKEFHKTKESKLFNRRINLPALKRNGQIIPVEVSIIPNKIGERYFISTFVRDLTAAKKSERTLNAINDLAKSLLGKNTLEEIAQEITSNTIEKFGFEDCTIYIYNEESETLEKIASFVEQNTGINFSQLTSIPIGKGLVGKTFVQATPVLINDTSDCEDYQVGAEIRFSELCVPIIESGKVIGVIDSEHRKKDFFTEEHLKSLITVANLISTQVKNAIITKKREETEASLRESEQRWEGLINNQTEGVIITKDGYLEYSNAAGLKLYEAESLEKLKGKNLLDFIPEKLLPVFINRMKTIKEKGFSTLIELELITLKGKTRFAEVSSNLITYNGESMIQSVMRDVTARKEAERLLKESDERWQSLIENLPEAVQISYQGDIEYMNPAGLKLYEVSSVEQIKGLSLFDLVEKNSRQILKERIEKLKYDEFIEPQEFIMYTLKGNKKIIEANSTAVKYKDRRAVQTVVRDVTEKKKAEKELMEISSRLSTLLNNLSTGILMEEPDHTILHINECLLDLFGSKVSPEEMVGENIRYLMPELMGLFKNPDDFAEKTLSIVDNKEPVNGQHLELKDGRTFERDFIPIKYQGKYLGNVWQYRDVTQKKESEKELIKALEIERNYNELNKNFVSMVSHEFRTPLTSIHSTAELLLLFGERFKGKELKKRIERIYNSSIKMDSLIQDVLTIGKLESENTDIENSEFNISRMINDTIEVLSAEGLAGKTVEVINKGSDTKVYCDENLMGLTLRNLLENAGKYSPKADKILVTYSVSNKGLEISCQDFGIGIPESDQETIFESFKRGSNTEDIKGTGLGLPIVKKAVNKMGGTINLKSEINKGTKISIKLPNQNIK